MPPVIRARSRAIIRSDIPRPNYFCTRRGQQTRSPAFFPGFASHGGGAWCAGYIKRTKKVGCGALSTGFCRTGHQNAAMAHKTVTAFAGLAALVAMTPSVNALNNKGVARLPGTLLDLHPLLRELSVVFQSWVIIVSTSCCFPTPYILTVFSLSAWNAFQVRDSSKGCAQWNAHPIPVQH